MLLKSVIYSTFALQKKITMGRGDKRTKRGKISNRSYGKSRPRKDKKVIAVKKA
jgi:30S ribosomal protein S31